MDYCAVCGMTAAGRCCDCGVTLCRTHAGVTRVSHEWQWGTPASTPAAYLKLGPRADSQYRAVANARAVLCISCRARRGVAAMQTLPEPVVTADPVRDLFVNVTKGLVAFPPKDIAARDIVTWFFHEAAVRGLATPVVPITFQRRSISTPDGHSSSEIVAVGKSARLWDVCNAVGVGTIYLDPAAQALAILQQRNFPQSIGPDLEVVTKEVVPIRAPTHWPISVVRRIAGLLGIGPKYSCSSERLDFG